MHHETQKPGVSKMKSLCTKLIVAFTITTALTTSMVRAEIPFYQAAGMLQNTKDQYKHLSPFWAMVAVHGKMLETIRFFGNYSKSDRLNEFGVNFDVGKDPIAIVIQALFSSPDGVQFVASTSSDGPVKNLSNNLGKINDIIEILLRPMEDILEIPEIKTLQEEKNKILSIIEELKNKQ